MNRIRTRSPFIIYRTDVILVSAEIELRIYSGDAITDKPVNPTVTLTTPALNNEIQIEVSNEISSFYEENFSGVYTTDGTWCEITVRTYELNETLLNTSVDLYSLFDGYTEFEDGANYDEDYSLAQSNCDIVTNDLEPINIPVDTSNGDVTVSFYNKGELQETKIVQQSKLSEETIQYVTNSIGDFDRFSSRVLSDSGVIEAKKCLKEVFDDVYETIDVDSIVVSSNVSYVSSLVKRNNAGFYNYYIPNIDLRNTPNLYDPATSTGADVKDLFSGNTGNITFNVAYGENITVNTSGGGGFSTTFTGSSIETDVTPSIALALGEANNYGYPIQLPSLSGNYKELKVKEIEECKYTPYKVTFKDKFGAWQDLWMFKRSDESMSTKSESYKNNLITNGSYNTNRHQYRVFNKSGRKKIKLSSGYYPESYNQVFEELNLSEYVYITMDSVVKPVNIKDGEFQFKKKVNEKLINYTVDFDYAFDAINTVR